MLNPSKIPMYGVVDFTPYDPGGSVQLRMICDGVTVLPTNVRAWINQDGALVDVNGTAGVNLYPTVGCDPVGAAYQAKVNLYKSLTSAEVIWTELKQIPVAASVDWGSLSVAATKAPAYSRVGSISMSLQNPQVTDSGTFQWKPGGNFVITGFSCSTDQGSVSINLDVRGRDAPNVSGTTVTTDTVACATVPAQTQTISRGDVTSANVIALLILGSAGSPGVVRVFVDYKQIP